MGIHSVHVACWGEEEKWRGKRGEGERKRGGGRRERERAVVLVYWYVVM